MKRNNNKGFTLAELLIVVAVIAVLVAVAIPTFGSQLEKARQATDMANLRDVYAAAKLAVLNQEEAPLSTNKPDATGNVFFWVNADTGEFTKATANSDAPTDGTATMGRATTNGDFIHSDIKFITYATATKPTKTKAILVTCNYDKSNNVWTLVDVTFSATATYTAPSETPAPTSLTIAPTTTSSQTVTSTSGAAIADLDVAALLTSVKFGDTDVTSYTLSGTLPSGLSWSSNKITGTPEAASAEAEYTIIVTSNDAGDSSGKTGTFTLKLTVVKD